MSTTHGSDRAVPCDGGPDYFPPDAGTFIEEAINAIKCADVPAACNALVAALREIADTVPLEGDADLVEQIHQRTVAQRVVAQFVVLLRPHWRREKERQE